MPYAVTLIPGDGTGPEITEATRRVLEATGVEFSWEIQRAGLEMLEKHGTVLPDEVIESIKRTKVGLKGPITTPVGKGKLDSGRFKNASGSLSNFRSGAITR